MVYDLHCVVMYKKLFICKCNKEILKCILLHLYQSNIVNPTGFVFTQRLKKGLDERGQSLVYSWFLKCTATGVGIGNNCWKKLMKVVKLVMNCHSNYIYFCTLVLQDINIRPCFFFFFYKTSGWDSWAWDKTVQFVFFMVPR